MITIMGGSLYSGNIIPKAEFNIYHDPDAAKLVFNSGVKVIMSGLEVCYSGGVPHQALEVFKNKGRASVLVDELLEFFTQYSRTRNIPWSPIFDMTPIIHLLKPEIFESVHYHVDIETEGELCRGMTVADLREPLDPQTFNTEVLLSVNNEAFVKYFIASIMRLDQMRV
ncbi:Pyrimidine-specific ribonucleoside hydrolase RihA [bioreactor metagenome]|uniref:Pyrimidine-specific ribonucleoside hydrolase RihA n=1 Tax=bioreactor metagenome TaxID=1076179 RepID=A0A645D2K4_9ZZZZ